MSNSNQALKHDMDSENLVKTSLTLIPKANIKENDNKYEISHNFISEFGVSMERKGFFDDLGDFLV